MPALPASVSAPDSGGSPRLLLVVPNWVGDTVMAMPAVQLLRQQRPEARLIALAKPQVAPLWEQCPAVDAVRLQAGGWHGTLATAARLRTEGYAAAYILPNSFRSALIPFLARIPERRGAAGHWRAWLLTEKVPALPATPPVHQSREYMALLGVTDQPTAPCFPLFDPPAETRRRVVERLEALAGPRTAAPRVALFPGAARGPSKRWPVERFAELARRLAEAGARVLVLGTAAEQALCAAAAGGTAGAVNLAGNFGLAELPALLLECDLVVANDSGGMHLAAAMGVPVVAVFGITDPARTGPLGPRCTVLTAAEVRRSRDVPRNARRALQALATITVERVHEAARAWLEAPTMRR